MTLKIEVMEAVTATMVVTVKLVLMALLKVLTTYYREYNLWVRTRRKRKHTHRYVYH